MNKTVIEVAALVFGILLLIGLFLAYTQTGNNVIKGIETKISGFWNDNPDGNKAPTTGGLSYSILPTNLTNAKILIASL